MNLLYQNNMIVMDTRVILVTFYNLKWIIFIFFFGISIYAFGMDVTKASCIILGIAEVSNIETLIF